MAFDSDQPTAAPRPTFEPRELPTEPVSKLRTYLELMRLPNVFTAMADIFLGYLFTHENLEPLPLFGLLLGSSSLLYMAGMVLNDVFDVHKDAAERPSRPIPSGRVSLATARILGFGMLLGGVALAAGAAAMSGQTRPVVIAGLLALAVFLYDKVLKTTPIAPLAMGACRFLNVLLGMSASLLPWEEMHHMHWLVAGGIGTYIVGVTMFARTEAQVSNRPRLAIALLVMLAGIGLLAWYPYQASNFQWPAVNPPGNWLLFWGVIAILIGQRCLRAIADPRPALVQAAVKTSILSLIMLDAGALLPVREIFWAAAILLLWLPTVVIGRWIYST